MIKYIKESMSEDKKIKLDLGCGKNKLPGFIGVDIRPDTDADIVCSALELPYKNASVDEINCSHLVEHFMPAEARKLFDEIYRVLKIGGEANLKIDCDWSRRRLLKKDPEHKYRYSVAEIKDMVSGFSRAEVKRKFYFFNFYSFRNKIFVHLAR